MSKNLDNVISHFNENNYSRARWETHTESSTVLIPFLKSLNADLILDIGCGTNPYKGQVKNVIGMDAAFYPEADLHMSCEDAYDKNIFQNNSADAVLALGSINFGSWENIINQLSICINWCKPGGYVICRARLNDKTTDTKGFVQYGWKKEDVYTATDYFQKQVNMYKNPVIEKAVGGAHKKAGSHGEPDYEREISLAVWTWQKNEMV